MSKYDECLDDVKKQRGTYPYNTYNPCIGDGYFMQYIYKKYPKTMINKAIKECKTIEEKIENACKSIFNEEEQKMELKTVEEYSKEMTREEFDKFTEVEDACPHNFGLKDHEGCNGVICKDCYDQALVGIQFKAPVPGLPKEITPALMQLQELEIQAKSIEDQQKNLKEDLLKAMETHGVKKWDNDIMTVTYTAPTTRTSIDSTKLKKELPDVAEKYSKTSNVKSSIRIKLK